MKGLVGIYNALFERFGPQGWWPAESRFEVIIGAILTQNTNWKNVEKSIENIKQARLLEPYELYKAGEGRIRELIKPSGYFNQKAKKIMAFMEYFKKHNFSIEALRQKELSELREELLSVWGVGRETADAILLYALDKEVFVVDGYTRRIFSRLGMVSPSVGYEDLRAFFEDRLPKDIELYKEFHALIDELGKRYCKRDPRCEGCPLSTGICSFRESNYPEKNDSSKGVPQR